MNKAQQKVLEAVGIYSDNRLSLSGFSQSHIFDIKESRKAVEMPASVFFNRDNCLVLANSWFRESGMYLSWGSIGGIFLLSVGFFAALAVFYKEGLFNAPATLASGAIGFVTGYPLLFSAKGELKLQGLKYTIFNTQSKNVHFVSDVDFEPKTCRWDECAFCLACSAGSIEGYYYELKGYLFNEDGSVKDSFSFDDYHYMTSSDEHSRQLMVADLSARFEYVRRFMEGEENSPEPIEEYLDLSPSLSDAAHRLQARSIDADSKLANAAYSIVRIIFLIPFSVQVVGHYFFCRYCRLPQWPQSVIEECGEEVIPSR
jgi:hypothetical protein